MSHGQHFLQIPGPSPVPERVLRASRIRGQRLIFEGRHLTSERLKFAIEVACLEDNQDLQHLKEVRDAALAGAAKEPGR